MKSQNTPSGLWHDHAVRLLTPFLPGPSDQWHWSSDTFPPLSFCVRTLILDGLAVAPFDRHPDGDGGLRELGLDAEMWHEWVVSVIRQRETLGEHARSLGTPDARGPLLEHAQAAAEVMREPGTFCPGPAELRARLNALFSDYAPAGEAWKRRMSDVPRLHGSPRQQRALWNALIPFHARLATITAYFVEYVDPVVMLLPPTTCLIAPEDDPDGFRRQIVAAATGLAYPSWRAEL